MKKTLVFLMTLVTALLPCSRPAAAEQARVMASFYPVQILAMNVFDGIDGIELDCMTAPETGCLHDYMLNAGDMMKLYGADALIVCGAGMEAYLPDVQTQFPSLRIIDCSKGIDLLSDPGEADEMNAHTWLDAQNAIKIVSTIHDAAVEMYPEYAPQLNENTAAYIGRLTQLDEALKEMLQPVRGAGIVTFHEAFPYFARAYGLNIAAVISEEHEESLTPAQMLEVIETVKAAGTPPLFTEPQYASAAAKAIAQETGAKVCELDPLVTGEIVKDAYETGMMRNAQALLDALMP